MGKCKLLDDFINYLKCNNYAEGTIINYSKDVYLFFLFLKEYMDISLKIENFNIFILSKVKQADVIAFLVYLNVTRKNSSATRQRKLASIKKFYKWILFAYPEYIRINPIKNYWIENTERMPKVLNLKQAQMISSVFNEKNHRHYKRDNLIIKTFLITGIRLSELTAIKIKDINFDKNIIRILAKGNKEKIVYITKNLRKELLDYTKNRKEEEYLFNHDNNKLSSATIQYIVNKAYKLLKIGERGYSVHTLRHTSATILYENTKDILLVKEFLGHSTVLSTQIYSHISNDLVKNAVNSNPLNFV